MAASPELESYRWVAVAAVLLLVLAVALPARQGTQTNPNQAPRPPVAVTAPVVATADSNDQMIAVTGIDITGSSILYVIDTQRRQLAIYQATGGGAATRGVTLVGARRIDLDLQLFGYNDASEYKYEDLEKKFVESGLLERR
jgi:hypothetical protein